MYVSTFFEQMLLLKKFGLSLTFGKDETSKQKNKKEHEGSTSVSYNHCSAHSRNDPKHASCHLLDEKHHQQLLEEPKI